MCAWNHCRELGFLNNFLQNVFRLMPEQVLQTKDPKFKLQKTSEMFSTAPFLVFCQTRSSEILEQMSCWVSFEIILILTFMVWK